MHDCLSTIKICTLLVNIGKVMQQKKKKKKTQVWSIVVREILRLSILRASSESQVRRFNSLMIRLSSSQVKLMSRSSESKVRFPIFDSFE
jgi:hypothetical protein